MVSQQTKTVGTLVIALYLGYWYTNQESEAPPVSYYSGKLNLLVVKSPDKLIWKPKMEKKLSAFVLGATGAVGKELVKTLSVDPRFSRVTLIGRRPVPLNPDENPGHKKIDNQIVDFEKLDEYKEVFKGYDVGFSTLGTTRKKSGAEGFYRVDHDYVLNSAKLAKEGGVQHFHLVSTAGANKNAYFLYPKTKGEVEEEITQMEFPRLSIYRPSLLLVDGGREESRLLEGLLQSLAKPLDKKRWFSVDVPELAKVMVANCFREAAANQELIDNATINQLAKQVPISEAGTNPGNTGPSPTE